MKFIICVCTLFLCMSESGAQNRIIARNAYIKFSSKTPLENIEAINKSGVSVIDKTTGQLEFSVLLKGFSFERVLMQEHFNENYVESDQYPKALFKGIIKDIQLINFAKKGKHSITVNGSLQLHGVTKEVTVKAFLNIQDELISADCNFIIVPSDYNIEIPGLVKDKIAKTVEISINANYR